MLTSTLTRQIPRIWLNQINALDRELSQALGQDSNEPSHTDSFASYPVDIHED